MRDERKGYIWRGLGRAERSRAFSGDNQIVMEYGASGRAETERSEQQSIDFLAVNGRVQMGTRKARKDVVVRPSECSC
jgi:hypothetical protein